MHFRKEWQDGTIHFGDNLEILAEWKVRADLIYMDPPFFSQKYYRLGSEQTSPIAFSDKWSSREEYLRYMYMRLHVAFQSLKPTGTFFLHVDPTMVHHLKVECDDIFGFENFQGEIIWRYRRWPAKTPNFQGVHDVILQYRREKTPTWNQLYEPLAPSTLKQWGTTKQRAVVHGGKRTKSSRTKEQSLGVPMGDVWDISILAPQARERTGYPTQKPVALLERLIEARTNPRDLVLDMFAGSGTTAVAARKLGRRFMMIDSSQLAFDVMNERLGTT